MKQGKKFFAEYRYDKSNTRVAVDAILKSAAVGSLVILALASIAIAERLKPQEQLINSINRAVGSLIDGSR